MARSTALLTLASAAAVLFGVRPAAAQMGGSGDPTVVAVQNEVKMYAQRMVAAAKEMPEAKYDYKPTEKQRSFGDIIAHIAGSNGYMCSGISGMDAPASVRVDHSASKDAKVAALQASFDFCNTALSHVQASDLSGQMDFFGGRKISKAAGLVNLAMDLADHYGQQAMYLRLNGMLPPTAQGGSM
ncbi:MAG TPA: DinB family protein [Gemmatimonadota bacterium]|nr:DinB family protein [Gemmatimonadota bacterium]